MAWRRDRDRPRRRQTDPPTPSFAWRRLADSGPTERETLRFGPAAWWTSPGSYSYGTHRRFFCIVWDTVRGHMIYLLPLNGGALRLDRRERGRAHRAAVASTAVVVMPLVQDLGLERDPDGRTDRPTAEVIPIARRSYRDTGRPGTDGCECECSR